LWGEFLDPLFDRGDHVVALAAAQFDLGAVADAVLLRLQRVEQLLDRLAVDLRRLGRLVADVGDLVDAAVDAVAVGVPEIVLEVGDQWVLPVGEVDGAVGADLQIRGAEVRVARRNERLLLDPDEAGATVLELEAADALEADHVGYYQAALPVGGEVLARED